MPAPVLPNIFQPFGCLLKASSFFVSSTAVGLTGRSPSIIRVRKRACSTGEICNDELSQAFVSPTSARKTTSQSLGRPHRDWERSVIQPLFLSLLQNSKAAARLRSCPRCACLQVFGSLRSALEHWRVILISMRLGDAEARPRPSGQVLEGRREEITNKEMGKFARRTVGPLTLALNRAGSQSRPRRPSQGC